MKTTIVLSLLLALCALGARAARAGGEIHGTITTRDGHSYTGPIRWDKNENFWDDQLDARKNDHVKVAEDGGLDLRILGIQIVHESHSGSSWTRSQFSVPFGQVRAIEPDGSTTRVALKDGDTVEVRSDGDLGSNMRGVVVETIDSGRVKLDWKDLARVEFSGDPAPSGNDAERLYGTVKSTAGSFTGYVVWDRDESLGEDVLDGEENGDDRDVPFSVIRRIERVGSGRSKVELRSGTSMLLSGTNDVNDGNRGIVITVAGLGNVEVSWDDFESVTFTDPPASRPYQDFDGGGPITGTVTTRDGASKTGVVVWDEDEARTWEALDGQFKGARFQVLFGNIARIERNTAHSARVQMKDGTTFVLEKSNDVDETNKGIEVTAPDGSKLRTGWNDFVSLDLGAS